MLQKIYSEKVASLTEQIANRKAKNKLFITGEIVTFLAFVLFFILFVSLDFERWAIIASLIAVIVYAYIRKMDNANSRITNDLECHKGVYEDELKYLTGDFSAFDDGARYSDGRHAFAYDLDVFGKDSLYNRINRTVTSGGSDVLADNLRNLKGRENAAAIKELAEQTEWRADFLATGRTAGRKIDTMAMIEAIKNVRELPFPRFASSGVSLAMAYVAMLGFYAAVACSISGMIDGTIAVWWAIVQFFVVIALCGKILKRVEKATGALQSQISSYIQLIALVAECSDFKVEENRKIVAQLDGAIVSFARMKKIIHSLESRSNGLGLLLFNILFLNDFFLVRHFLKWQNEFIDKVNTWVEAISEIDARISMATMRYNHPEAVDAEIVEGSDKMIYEAKGLYHPFLGKEAVRNDFVIEHENYYIITGANMAGKSTFLRAVGINYVLAMAGMPVFADKFRVSVYSLFSSMRTTDDLTHGISYFNAELLRLKQLIDACRENRQTLIILDEILKGTNSLDKLNGSRLFLESISRLPVSGIIATHDLELSKMAEQQPDVFHNYCFEIELGAKVTYSYKITRGVARNQNATYLLKQILK
ncbi:MAG: DNA mismatch repair protein MutS [Prevotella sp.]|jgi:hypothetical protein|nr:DNA mismatch repair protein MutS [Prevotella sp.]